MKSMYKTTIQNCDVCVAILRRGSDDTFFALVLDATAEGRYAIGQLDDTSGYYHLRFLREDCVYQMLAGDLDWQDSEVWKSDYYTYGELECGFMKKQD